MGRRQRIRHASYVKVTGSGGSCDAVAEKKLVPVKEPQAVKASTKMEPTKALTKEERFAQLDNILFGGNFDERLRRVRMGLTMDL